MTSFLAYFSQILLLVLGIFLMIIVLLQRGRGGGLAGAFGGMGGQSAFGSKAGDVFTKITIVIAVLWVVVAGGSGFFLRAAAEQEGRSRLESSDNLQDEDEDPTDADATGPVIPPQPPQPPQPPAGSTTTPAETATPADAEPDSTPEATDESATGTDGASDSGEPASPGQN